MKDGVGVNGTPLDIIDNPKRIRIVEVEAATLPRALDDLDAAVINSNYALGANLNPTKDAIAIEAKRFSLRKRCGCESRERKQTCH